MSETASFLHCVIYIIVNDTVTVYYTVTQIFLYKSIKTANSLISKLNTRNNYEQTLKRGNR